MADLKDLLSGNDPELIKQSLELLAAFREIKDPHMRQAVSELAKALRQEQTKSGPASETPPEL